MAKQGGMGDNFYVGAFDLSGDVNSVQRVGGGPAPWETTGINKSAIERIGLALDGAMDWTSYFNDATGQAHPTLKALPTTDTRVSYFRGTAVGSPACSAVAKQVNYDGTRAANGALTFAVNALPNGYGVEWGQQLTAGKRTDTTGTNGASVDYGAVSTLFGLAAYLHVFSITGTSVTVTLEDSADNSSFAPITGGAFTAAAAATSERIQTGATATVRRYVRAVTSGTFSNAVFAVNFVRYLTAPVA